MPRSATTLPSPSELTVRLETGAATTALVYPGVRHGVGPDAGAAGAAATLILGHGAGAGQRSAFMVDFAHALSAQGVDVVTFNFLYIEHGRKIPDRGPALEACYRAVIEAVRATIETARRALFIGGKSMGGRIATQVAAADPQLPIAGLVLLGYPLHPPGRPTERRDKHLPGIARPMLFVQGTRDAFGTPDELAPILGTLRPAPAVHVVAQGDHSFKLSRKDPEAQAAIYAGVQRAIVDFVREISGF
jgi:predicted alpha/beta-hydrolase family hydrolase